MEKRVLILGLGNLLLSDEGVGVHVAQTLQRMVLPSGVEVIDGGTGGFELIGAVRGRSKVIIIDCLKMDEKPGSIVRLGIDEISLHQPLPFSVHDSGVRELLAGILELQPRPEVVIFGVIPYTADNPGMNLSVDVKARLSKIVSLVLEEAVKRDVETLPSDIPAFDLGGGD